MFAREPPRSSPEPHDDLDLWILHLSLVSINRGGVARCVGRHCVVSRNYRYITQTKKREKEEESWTRLVELGCIMGPQTQEGAILELRAS